MEALNEDEVRKVVEAVSSDPFFACESIEIKDTLRLIVASCHLGTNADRLAKFLGLNRDKFVRPRAKLLRENGIWKDGKVYLEGADNPDETHLGLGLILAALAAEGVVVRTPGPFLAPDGSALQEEISTTTTETSDVTPKPSG